MVHRDLVALEALVEPLGLAVLVELEHFHDPAVVGCCLVREEVGCCHDPAAAGCYLFPAVAGYCHDLVEAECSPEQVPGGGQGPGNLANGLKVLSAFSPWKHPKRLRLGVGGPGDETTYDLYGVCNHHGTDLQGGHYTAYCRNPTDSQWYFFDDVNTRRISEADIVTKDAYILFYQKSSLAASTSSSASGSSSSSSSSTGSNPDHWVYRMPDFYYKAKNETKCAPAPRTSAKAAAKKEARSKAAAGADKRKVDSSSCGAADAETGAAAAEESFTRNSRKYATMPSKRTSDLITIDTDNYSDTEQAAAESDEDTDTAPSR